MWPESTKSGCRSWDGMSIHDPGTSRVNQPTNQPALWLSAHWLHSWVSASSFADLLTRFAWWQQDLHAIELLRAHIGEWTITWMLDYWWVMCFTSYQLNWDPWIWIPFPVDSDCTLLCTQVDRTRYSSIASGNNCIVQLCKCVSLHL
jgi:hypothetical protein